MEDHKTPKNEATETSSLKIVGLNLLVFAFYTLICVSTGGEAGFFAFILAGLQAFICVIVAIIAKRWIWVLSALMLLIIGFATCLGTFSLGSMH